MPQPKQLKIDKFFEAYAKRDFNGIRQVMAEDAVWYFIGRHPLAGIKHGVDEIVAFFDRMGTIIGKAKPQIEKPIVAENDDHVIECVHTKTNREDGKNLDHFACVLWTFKDGKIAEGRHFFADPPAVDAYFTSVAG
jgi:ketosteroid isomerase-like protein